MRPTRTLALTLLTAFLLVVGFAPTASAYSWDRFKEDFQYKPVAFIVAVPAFLITAPFMLIDSALEAAADDE